MQKLNYYIGQLFSWLGYSIIPSWKTPECNLNLLELSFALLESKNILPLIVQIGSFDGLANDHLSNIIAKKNYEAAYLVEPQPKAVYKLQQQYDNKRNVHIIEAAICNTDGYTTMYSCGELDQKASINISHFSRFGLNKSDLTKFMVEGVTAQTFCLKYNINRIDILQIDTEGLDLDILKMFLNIIHPNIINFEKFHLSKQQYTEARELLKSQGYNFIEYDYDILAVSENIL
ncbi:FkbM family methyltransferase [Nodularia harveyana UHCC-0300]|uniref:FkbM family methyltransferase n=1 Tax=Nodularia harveyana UHCC-0300 TaxID=2974287 RepID=A0ABU5UK51_9CYAN|nr:FkbM family methyltransferase [Nodularia harveyana]MEA5583326.1 FkbM family methyltransferase [Nodularia harveyana UHCC-0300]